MKKAFTLLELVVVIIILGVLATLGFTQYGRMVEKSRGAEARQILGDIRKLAYAYWFQKGTLTGITNADLNIGTATDQIPSNNLQSTHWFYYGILAEYGSSVQVYACRCLNGGGKSPTGVISGGILMIVNTATGQDFWQSSPGACPGPAQY